eukprot:6181515-Pleurochrysis_carterae.AAC.1
MGTACVAEKPQSSTATDAENVSGVGAAALVMGPRRLRRWAAQARTWAGSDTFGDQHRCGESKTIQIWTETRLTQVSQTVTFTPN